MRRFLLITSLILSIISCNSSSSDSDVFESEKLRGKYKVDLSPFIAEATKSNKNDDGFSKFANGIAAMAMSSVKVEMNFYEGDKGTIYIDGGLVDFMNAMDNNSTDKVTEFDYKVEQDSVLYMKQPKDAKYEKWAIVKKFAGNYDHLKFLILKEGKGKVYFNLHKMN